MPTSDLRLPIFTLLAILFAHAPSCFSQAPSARELDALLQRHAFEALSFRPKTGVVLEAKLPEDLTGQGVSASAVRLRSGSLRHRGFKEYGEFHIPVRLTVQPYAKRIVLVYQNLGSNLTSQLYPLAGFTYLAPLLGLIAYDASNLSAVDPPELDLRATGKPIEARFGSATQIRPTSTLMCAFFDLHGSVQFDPLTRGGACQLAGQGHVAIVAESPAPYPAPSGGSFSNGEEARDGNLREVKIIGCVVGVLVLIGGASAVGLILWDRRTYVIGQRRKAHIDDVAAFGVTSFGNVRAPFARVTRTQPVLEERYVP